MAGAPYRRQPELPGSFNLHCFSYFEPGEGHLFTAMNHIKIDKRVRLLAGIAQEAAKAAGKPAALDITAIRHYPVREPASGKRYSLLRITTRSGLIGWGESPHDQNADTKALESVW